MSVQDGFRILQFTRSGIMMWFVTIRSIFNSGDLFHNSVTRKEWKESKAKQIKSHSIRCDASKQTRRFIMRVATTFLCSMIPGALQRQMGKEGDNRPQKPIPAMQIPKPCCRLLHALIIVVAPKRGYKEALILMQSRNGLQRRRL